MNSNNATCVLGVWWMGYGCVVNVLRMCCGCVVVTLWVYCECAMMCFGRVVDVLWVYCGSVMDVRWRCYGCMMNGWWNFRYLLCCYLPGDRPLSEPMLARCSLSSCKRIQQVTCSNYYVKVICSWWPFSLGLNELTLMLIHVVKLSIQNW